MITDFYNYRYNPLKLNFIHITAKMVYHLLILSIFVSIACSSCSSNDENDPVKKPVQYRLRQIMIEPAVSHEHEEKILNNVKECIRKAQGGEDFTLLAKTFSQEPGAKNTGGDLGFFSPEEMVKPFSDIVFSIKPGEIKGPVNTQFGYHIIKLLEIRGDKRHAQHILFLLNADSKDSLDAFNKLIEIRELILDGADFDEMFKLYNNDALLKKTDGYMVWNKPSDMMPSFAKNIKGLKKGELSEPFVSILGFHIVKVDSINYDEKHILEGFPAHIEKRMK